VSKLFPCICKLFKQSNFLSLLFIQNVNGFLSINKYSSVNGNYTSKLAKLYLAFVQNILEEYYIAVKIGNMLSDNIMCRNEQ